MRAFLQRTCFSVLAAGLAAGVQASGADELAPDRTPMAAVGRLTTGAEGLGCSAVLIAPDLVLTAAHCGPIRIESVAPGTVSFRTGRYPGQPTQTRIVVEILRHPLYSRSSASDLERIGADLALARLEAPVSEAIVAPLPIGPAGNVGERLFVVSWADNSESRARERTCPTIDAEARVTILACTVVSGESGAPLLRPTANGPEIVGIMSSRSQDGAKQYGFAVNAKARVGQLMALMPGVRAAD